MRYAGRVARKYAQALTSLAEEGPGVEPLVTEVERIRDRLAALPELAVVLDHRQIALERKLDLARRAFQAPASGGAEQGEDAADVTPLSELGFNFLQLLIHHRRVDLVPQIAAALGDELDRRQSIVRATVTTAVPLLKSEREMIETKLRELTGAEGIVLETQVAKTILGGVVIHVGQHVIDASVRTYLDTMRERLRRVRVADFDQGGLIQLPFEELRRQVSADG